MFTSAEIAILESLSRGGKDLRSTTDPSDLSSLVGVTLDNKAVVNAFTFLHREGYVYKDATADKYYLSSAGKDALEKADQQQIIRQNFQLLENQLKASNDLSQKLVQELHDQAESYAKERKESEKNRKKEKRTDRFFSFVIGVLVSVTASLILFLLG